MKNLRLAFFFSFVLFSCEKKEKADIVFVNGQIYSFSWADPDQDGTIDPEAPFNEGKWTPDAHAIAILDGKIIALGSEEDIAPYISESTKKVDLKGGYVFPGMVDSHTHVMGLGKNMDLVDLTSAANEEEAVELVMEFAQTVPKGEWIVGRGWDEGAWANNYPDMKLLSEKVPDHPVFMNSLHGFAAWGNELAFESADISIETPTPVGGEIVKDENGIPTGLLMNNATDLLANAVPPPDFEKLKQWTLSGLQEMAKSGYVAIHDAGVGTDLMKVMFDLDQGGELPIRVYAMIRGSHTNLMEEWEKRGPYESESNYLFVKSVKAYYDGALGSRGARLIEDYSDMEGHRGVSGENYGFDEALVERLINAGFQVGIHAIGDAGNRETMDFLSKVASKDPNSKNLRHRIEHAQVVHPDDFEHFGNLQLIGSMQPPHAAEDKTWAEERLGPERVTGAYAWRKILQSGGRLTFGSDLTGSDHNIFYGLHSTITRRSKDLMPKEGWYVDQALTAEEAIRGYSSWAAYASFLETMTGTLEVGKWADLTVLSIDPLNTSLTDPSSLLDGKVLFTIVGGNVVYEAK